MFTMLQDHEGADNRMDSNSSSTACGFSDVGNNCDYVSHESNSDLSDMTLNCGNAGLSFLDDILEKSKLDVYNEEIHNLSVGVESNINEFDGNMNSSALSLEVSSSELADFEIITDDIVNVAEIQSDLHNVDDKLADVSKSPESRLHCAVCGNIFAVPKFLSCLHTFCLICLQKDFKQRHRFIFCPLCRIRTNVPSGGLCNLMDNTIVSRMILSNENSQPKKKCVICKLHDIERDSWGQCLDCGDIMCKDCGDKHTFTRQSAKHNVVSFEQIYDDPHLLVHMKNITYCRIHNDSEAELFCKSCVMSLCKYCGFTEHSHHDMTEIRVIEAEKSATIHKCLKSVEEACKHHLEENSKEASSIINEKEAELFKELTETKRHVLSAIETKFDKCLKQIKKEFDIKRRKYCTHRSAAILRRNKATNVYIDAVNFILSQGQVDEIATLENLIVTRAHDITEHITMVFPKLTRDHNSWPKVLINKSEIKLIDSMKIVSSSLTKGSKQEKEMFALSGDGNLRTSRQINTNQTKKLNEFTVSSKGKLAPLLSVPNSRIQSKHLIDKDLNERGSLLGEYPGQVHVQSCCDYRYRSASYSYGSFQDQGIQSVVQYDNQSCEQVQLRNDIGFANGFTMLQTQHNEMHNVRKKSEINDYRFGNFTPSSENISVKLRSGFVIKVVVDKREPDITDMCFLGFDKFALVDARNLRLKIFSTAGKFLNFIDDPGPLSVTCCANHLVWSSQYSSLKLYDLSTERIIKVKKLDPTSPHALTSFNNMKYLIRSKGRIEACCVDGHTAHVIEPHDMDGNSLLDISCIATRSHDQLVIVDRQQKKVVVNNFDGHCIGEYYNGEMDPGAVCITEQSLIFLTDRRNKLILLSQSGKFIKEWKTVVNSPCCIACNGKGLLLVGGDGNHVSLYAYS